MQAFAALLDALSYQPARNAKLRLIETYLKETPDPNRGWALAAQVLLIGVLILTVSFKNSDALAAAYGLLLLAFRASSARRALDESREESTVP